nr:unnamed protein product [Callosobruchus analis]
MLCCRQRFFHTNNLYVVCSLLLAAGFILQIKLLYNNHQKHLRFLEINNGINEVYEAAHLVERLANHTNSLINKMDKTMKSYKYNKIRLKGT